MQAIPAASSIVTDKIGGRVRGPSPLVHQWIDFCLQSERASPFEKEIIAGASPSALERGPNKNISELLKNKPKLDTNLVAGMPPADILERCEFLEPLSETALSDYQWLTTSMKNPSQGNRMIQKLQGFILFAIQTCWLKLSSKVA